nr:hypothetical protein [Sphingobacterium sp. GVS05A]
MAGEHALAFKYLKAAVQKDGLHQVDMLTQDADFISLHSDPQWKEILKEVAENAKNRKKEDAMFFNRNSFWDSKNLVTAFRPNLSAEEKLAGLSKFWSEAKYNFVNFDLVPAYSQIFDQQTSEDPSDAKPLIQFGLPRMEL